MAYLASRGDIKTTVYQQTTSSYSYYTNRLNIISPSITSAIPTYSSMSGTHKTSGESYIRSSTDGHIMTYEYRNTSHTETQWPDGFIDVYVGNTSGFQVSKSFTTMIPQQVTTSVARYSGSQHCNPVDATRKLCLRTGTGEHDVVKYGLTTRTDAKEYCGLRMNIDGQVAYIGRSEAQDVWFTKTRNNAHTRSTYTSTITSTVSSISSYRTYTNSGNIDSYSYVTTAPTGWSYYNYREYTYSWNGYTTSSFTSSHIEYRASSWTHSATTSKIQATTWTTTKTSSRSSYSGIYANSTYTSYCSYGTEQTKYSYWCSGNRSTRCNNNAGQMIQLGVASSYHYSIYETFSKSGYKQSAYYTSPVTTYATTTRQTTSLTTYVNSMTNTYVSSHNSLSTSVAANTGSYTTSSFEGYITSYFRVSSLSSIYRGAHVANNSGIRSADCLFNVAGNCISTLTTNWYEMNCSNVESLLSSTNSYRYMTSSSNDNLFSVSAQSGDKSTFYSGNSATVSAKSSIFTITRTGGYAVSWSTDFRNVSVYGIDQVISVSTTQAHSIFGTDNRTETFTSAHYDRQYVYTTGVTTSVSSSGLNLAAGSYQRTSVDGRQYTVSVPGCYITRNYSGNTVTDHMGTFTTQSYETYSSYTHTILGDAIGGGGALQTATEYDGFTRYYTRTRTASMTLTDYLNARKMLTNVTTGTRTTAYTTSRNTTYTTNMATTSLLSTSWYQRTTASGVAYGSASGSGTRSYDNAAGSASGTVSVTFPGILTYCTNQVSRSYNGISNTTMTSTARYTGVVTSVDGYTMSMSLNGLSDVTYTHILDSANGVQVWNYPEGTDGITVSSRNYSTYSLSNVNTIVSKHRTDTTTGSYAVLSNVTGIAAAVSSVSYRAQTTYMTMSNLYGSIDVAEYSSNNTVSTYYTIEHLKTSSFYTSKISSTWKNEFFKIQSNVTQRGYSTSRTNTCTTSSGSTMTKSSKHAAAGISRTTTLSNSASYGGDIVSANHFTVSTSSTISSKTSRTTYASASRYSSYINHYYYSTYNRHYTSGYSSYYHSTWSGYECFSSRTYKVTNSAPYILTSVSQIQHGEDFGAYTTSGLSYMSLQPATTTGNLCTYSYHTNSYYSSISVLDADSAYTHGFICDSSLSNMTSNSSATTYELNYTGSEAVVSAANPSVAFSRSSTSSLEFNSFTHMVGSLAASLGLLVSYSKATLSKSYLSYLTSSILQHYTTTVHNYEM